MTRLRVFVLLLTVLALLPAGRLAGQAEAKYAYGGAYNTPAVCNDGTIAFGVARAYLDNTRLGSGDWWTIEGWYVVNPGECNEIGPQLLYGSGGWFGADSVTYLAFTFTDSTGVWGSVRVSDSTDGIFKATNQQICILADKFRLVHPDSDGGVIGQDCSQGRTGIRIQASLAYKGDSYYGFTNSSYGGQYPLYPSTGRDRLHVRLVPGDRAVSLGAKPVSGSAPPPPPPAESSVGDQVLKALGDAIRQSAADAANKAPTPEQEAKEKADAHAAMLGWVRADVTDYIAASANGFDAYKKGDPQQMDGGVLGWQSNTKPLAAKGCWVMQAPSATTFSCLLLVNPDLTALRTQYDEIAGDVAASLPAGWTQDAAPPYGPDLPASVGFHAENGAHGEIWIAQDGSTYQMHYQLVAPGAAAQPPAPAPPGDDPIGPGGFIKPPS